LTVEIYRWVGKALLPFLQALKPIQLKELQHAFDNLPEEKALPERTLKSQWHAPIPTQSSPESNSIDTDSNDTTMEPVEMDPFDLAEPIAILSKLPVNFDELLNSENWKERKEALDTLLPILSVPRIAEGKYGELVNSLSKVRIACSLTHNPMSLYFLIRVEIE
jgi:cytoskeleton-associated protein 5